MENLQQLLVEVLVENQHYSISYQPLTMKINNQEYNFQRILFLQMLTLDEIDGEYYYLMKKPMVINTDFYEVSIGIIDRESKVIDTFVEKDGKRINQINQYSHLIKSYYFEVGDEVQLVIYANGKLSKVSIVWTKEMLGKGMYNYYYDLKIENEPKPIMITMLENYEFIYCSINNTYSRYDVSSNKQNITVYYLDSGQSMNLHIEYRYNNSD